MKKSSISVAALICALTVATASTQTAESPLQFERGFPTAVTAEKAHDAADLIGPELRHSMARGRRRS